MEGKSWKRKKTLSLFFIYKFKCKQTDQYVNKTKHYKLMWIDCKHRTIIDALEIKKEMTHFLFFSVLFTFCFIYKLNFIISAILGICCQRLFTQNCLLIDSELKATESVEKYQTQDGIMMVLFIIRLGFIKSFFLLLK